MSNRSISLSAVKKLVKTYDDLYISSELFKSSGMEETSIAVRELSLSVYQRLNELNNIFPKCLYDLSRFKDPFVNDFPKSQNSSLSNTKFLLLEIKVTLDMKDGKFDGLGFEGSVKNLHSFLGGSEVQGIQDTLFRIQEYARDQLLTHGILVDETSITKNTTDDLPF